MDDLLAAWKKVRSAGGCLVGCFPLYPPLELFHSFGLTPVVLWAMGDARPALAASDAHVQPYACRIARFLTGFVLDHGPGLFDALFMYNACDTLRNLPEIVTQGLEARSAHIPFFRIHVPAVAPAGAHAPHYLQARVRTLIEGLERFCRRPFSETDFQASARLYSRQRSLCRSLEDLCAQGKIPFSLASPLLERAHHTDVETHIRELEEAIDQHRDSRPAVTGVRVMVSGIQAPPRRILEAIDACGLVVASNDVATMARTYASSPEPCPDVYGYLGRFYSAHHPCTTILPSSDLRLENLRSVIRRRRIRGFIVFAEKFCEYEYFEIPQISSLLAEEGVKTLVVEMAADDEENLMPHITRIEAFAETLTHGTGG